MTVPLPADAVVNFETDPANVNLVNGSALVSGQAISRGTLVLNGQAISRGTPVLSSGNVTDTSNSKLAVILNSDDLAAASISTPQSINMVTALTAGVNTIVPGAMLSNNFNITYGLGHMTINPAILTIRALDTSTAYATEAVYSDSVTGFQYLDSIANVFATLPTHTLTNTQNNPVNGTPGAGNYIIVPGGATPISPANYTLHYVNGNLAVNKNTLTALAKDTARQYGLADPVFAIKYTGFVNGDGVSAITPPTASTTATMTSPVGTYPISLMGGSAANYDIIRTNGTLTITKAALTATADNKTRVYGDPKSSIHGDL